MIKEISYCGLYCGACPSYQKGTCFGCRAEDKKQSRKSKWGCKIRKCCLEVNKLQYCGQCNDFPCNTISKKLINSHLHDPRFNYRHKIPENMLKIKKLGLEGWLIEQEELWTCLYCGKRLMFYYNRCSGCGKERDPQAS